MTLDTFYVLYRIHTSNPEELTDTASAKELVEKGFVQFDRKQRPRVTPKGVTLIQNVERVLRS